MQTALYAQRYGREFHLANVSLRYRGIDVGEFARHSSYEETAYLLWFGELPTQAQLENLNGRMVEHRELDWGVKQVISALPRTLEPMEALRTVVSVLPSSDPESNDYNYGANIDKAIRLTAKFPTIVAYYQRHLDDLDFVTPNPELSHAANFLYMLHGQGPTPLEASTMDLALVLMAEHGFNASTFAARVTASTLSDMYSTITTAVGTLKGMSHECQCSGFIFTECVRFIKDFVRQVLVVNTWP